MTHYEEQSLPEENYLALFGCSFCRVYWDRERIYLLHSTYCLSGSHCRHTFLLGACIPSLCLSDNSTLRYSKRRDGTPGIHLLKQASINYHFRSVCQQHKSVTTIKLKVHTTENSNSTASQYIDQNGFQLYEFQEHTPF